jgi:hypothetical protein
MTTLVSTPTSLEALQLNSISSTAKEDERVEKVVDSPPWVTEKGA